MSKVTELHPSRWSADSSHFRPDFPSRRSLRALPDHRSYFRATGTLCTWEQPVSHAFHMDVFRKQ